MSNNSHWPPWDSPRINYLATEERSVPPTIPLGSGDILEILESVYPRPDIRALVIEQSHAFVELLSRDEEAASAFQDLAGGFNSPPSEGERLAPLVIAAVMVGCAAAGAVVGYFSRP